MNEGYFFRMLFFVVLISFSLSTKAQNNIAQNPYRCDFENQAENAYWVLRNSGTNKWVIDTTVRRGGRRSLYISNSNGAGNAFTHDYKAICAYRRIAITPGQYSVSYDWKIGGYVSSGTQFMRVFIIADSVQLPNDSSFYYSLRDNILPQGAIPLDGGGRRVNTSNVWLTFSDDQVIMPDTGIYKLVFAWSSGTDPRDSAVAVDNISFIAQTCPKPYNLTAVVVGDSIMMDWTGAQPQGGWLVEYRPLGSPAASARRVITNRKPYFIPQGSVTQNTQYQMRVAALCGAGDTSLFSDETFVNYKLYQPLGRLVYDTLTAPHVKCTYGRLMNNGVVRNHQSGPFLYVGVVDSGSSDYYKSIHTVHRNPLERDSCTGYVVPTIYGGNSIYSAFHQQIKYPASVRLGRLGGTYEAQGLFYTIHVDSNSADVMMINYAFIENLGYHSSISASYPHLVIEILDTNDQVIDQVADIGSVPHFIPGTSYVPPYNAATNTYYKDWTSLAVNMTPYHGRTVKLCFSTYTCGNCAYVTTYSYLIPDYRTASLVSLGNNNKDNATTFVAPEGYKSYRWYLLSNPSVILDSIHQQMSIPNGENFACELVDVYGHTKVLRSFSSKRNPHSTFTCSVRAIDCNTKEIQLVNNSYMTASNGYSTLINGIEDSYWSINDGEKLCMLNSPTFTTTDTGAMKITLYTSTTNNTVIDSMSQIIYLSNVPLRTSIFDTIEYGETYTFAGKSLTQSGTYNDTIVSSRGCDSIVTLNLYVNGEDVSLNTVELEQVNVYPNPAGNQLTVSGCEVTNSAIFDGAGKVVLAFGKETQLDVSKLSAGIYTIRIETPAGTVMRKFVKK